MQEMKGKILAVLFTGLCMYFFASTAVATYYDVDDTAIGCSIISSSSVRDGSWNGYPIRNWTLTVENHSSTITYENTRILLQWCWIQDTTDGGVTLTYRDMGYQTAFQRWRGLREDDNKWMRIESHDEDGFITVGDIEGIQLSYTPTLQYPGKTTYWEEASLLTTDSVPYWNICTLAPGDTVTISARFLYYEEASTTDPFNHFIAGNIISATPIPEPGILMLLGLALSARLCLKRG